MRHKENVCIVGVGYVGEHLLQLFSKKFNVMGIDVCREKVQMLKAKYTGDTGEGEYGIKITDSFDESWLLTCNVFLICVPTLLTATKSVDTRPLEEVSKQLRGKVKEGSLIVVESSVSVGGTRRIFGDFHKKGIHVGFSPERIDPGRVYPQATDIPKVIAGIDSQSCERIKGVYQHIFKNLVPVSSLECAEMSKLFENCFRMVNIAYVNEIADMCESIGIDSKEMIAASSTKPFGFMPFSPGLGVGGHCIPVNPYYLTNDGQLPVLEMSTKLMEERPCKKAKQLIKMHPNVKSVLIVGLGFKKGESLLDNSPNYAFYKELRKTCDVTVYDPIVERKKVYTDGIQFMTSEEFTTKSLNEFDLIVVNHLYETKKENCALGECTSTVIDFCKHTSKN